MDSAGAEESNNTAIVVTIVVGLIAFIFFLVGKLFGTENEKEKIEEETGNGNKTHSQVQRVKKQNKLIKKSVFTFDHKYLHTSLKGHAGNVLGLHFSINGKYLATVSDDRTVRLWSVKDFGVGNKCIRVNVDLDHAKCIQFSPDSRAFVVGLSRGNTVRVFRIGKNEEGNAVCNPLENDFPEDFRQELLNIGVGATASGGSFVMTAYRDTTIIVRDLKGNVLHTLNTNLGNNNFACVSPCGRFVAASGWTPDVKVWEVKFTRTGEYKEVLPVFQLKGHNSSVWSFSFNNDSTRMLTVTKKGKWRLFDTDIEYEKGQEPSLIKEGEFDLFDLPATEHYCHCSLSFDGNVAAIAMLNNICIFSVSTGEVHSKFKEVHSEIITAISFDISGRYLISGGDRHVRVFHNLMGYKETIRILEEKIKKLPSASASRERLEQQQKQQKAALKSLMEKCG